MYRLYGRSLAFALLGVACAAPALPPAVTMTIEAPPAPTPSTDPPPGDALLAPVCVQYALYGHLEVYPRPPAFDAAARAFDQGTAAYLGGRFLPAAYDFLAAASRFLAADDVADRRWSYENAAHAFVMANLRDTARVRLLAAAAHDPVLAVELQKLADDLPPGCAGGE
jgi:hypothetical protein